jgi:TDG/mug DNA glycosylase family protein
LSEELKPLPDLIRTGLEIVFVGINPGLESSRQQRYFAHPRNRFWDAANMGGVFAPTLSAETGHLAIGQGIGFTDIVKRPTPGLSDLKIADFRLGAPILLRKLQEASPLIACFNGITPFQHFLRFALDHREKLKVAPGLQDSTVGRTRLFVVPSPSPANASYSLDDLAGWYGELARLRRRLAMA